MKIVINPDNLIKDENCQVFRKVRAIVENENGEFAISNEGGKYIFPGGKCENGETNLQAIIRELKEEMGIDFKEYQFNEILQLDTLYKDFYDYRSDSLKPRYTSTIYYYVKCFEKIDINNMNLTSGEISQGFKIIFTDKETLVRLLSEDHSLARNGKFFDEENRIVIEKILKNFFFDDTILKIK